MAILPATTEHAAAVRHLLRNGRHRFANIGREDLTHLLHQNTAALGEEHSGALWGFLGIRRNARPQTLPQSEPSIAHICALALAHRRSPVRDIPALLHKALEQTTPPLRVLYFGEAGWPVKPLLQAGFAVVERVAFLQLAQLQRKNLAQPAPPSSQVHLRAARPDDMPQLARLDAQTFAPVWHMGEQKLLQLLFDCRLQVAVQEEQEALLGYSALSIDADGRGHIARLAVAPAAQRQGLGRRLLLDILQYAQSSGVQTVELNTQTDNVASLALYHSAGFRATGLTLPLLSKIFS